MRAFKTSFYNHTQQFQFIQNNAFNLDLGEERLGSKRLKTMSNKGGGGQNCEYFLDIINVWVYLKVKHDIYVSKNYMYEAEKPIQNSILTLTMKIPL